MGVAAKAASSSGTGINIPSWAQLLEPYNASSSHMLPVVRRLATLSQTVLRERLTSPIKMLPSTSVNRLFTSVIIATYRRAGRLEHCLKSLALQITLPDEVIVVWQGDDVETSQIAEQLADVAPFRLKTVHQPVPGIVPAENAGLCAAGGEIILLIDDDAVAHPDWVRRHLVHYEDPLVGAVGGPYQNFESDGSSTKTLAPRRIGKLTWFGQFHGNMSDHPLEWRTRRPVVVNHLIGGNMSL